MSALKAPTDCVLYSRALHAYVDGELSADHTAELEAHIVKCGDCFDQVEQLRAVRLSLRRTNAAKAPAELRDRMAALVAAEAARAPGSDHDAPVRDARAAARDGRQAFPVRHVMLFAAAAGVVFAVGVARNRADDAGAASDHARGPASASLLSMNLDDFIDDLVDMHARPLPPETTNPEELPRFDPFVGVPVRRPASRMFSPLGVHYDGARIHAARGGRRAALLLYTTQDGHRATMYVFDAHTVPFQTTRLHERVVKEHPVYVGNVRGYSFAATERGGVGYGLASDLDDDISAKLVAAVQ